MRQQASALTLVGDSAPMRDVKDEIERIARSDAKVLITGESGSGKEIVAGLICAKSERADKPFVPVNCAGLPETLLESELFGHVKGSFTGAYRDAPGKLESADRGTIFMDEVGEMTLRMQGLLLRFLETGEIQKVGSDRPQRRVDVRVIAATNRNLTSMIESGEFREDLFYRLNVIHIIMPPLRERREDIPALIDFFLTRLCARYERSPISMSDEAQRLMMSYAWPGNVRELQNSLERLLVNARTDRIEVDDLPLAVKGQHPAGRPQRERRRTVADDLYKRLTTEQESFWNTVYPLYMNREITRQNVREVVRKGLEDARGSYKGVAKLFNLEPDDYKKFLNFLRKHECQLPYREFR
jgi:DNA-binding NtrC family response regulator